METFASIWPDVAPAPFLDTEEGRMSRRAAMPHLCFPFLGHIAFFLMIAQFSIFLAILQANLICSDEKSLSMPQEGAGIVFL